MADATLTGVGRTFPEGTTVGAYPADDWPGSQRENPSGAPPGSADDTADVTDGALAFTGLDEIHYFAGASVSGTWRYISFLAGADIDPSDDVAHQTDLDAEEAARVAADATKQDAATAATDAELAASDALNAASFAEVLAVQEPILRGASAIGTAQVAATYLPIADAGSIANGAGMTVAQAAALEALNFDDADYDPSIAGKTLKLVLRGSLKINNTAPGTITFTVALHNITGVAGGANAVAVTVNTTPVANSGVAFVNPSASTKPSLTTAAFTVPADGDYCICCTTNATSATNGLVEWQGRLFEVHV